MPLYCSFTYYAGVLFRETKYRGGVSIINNVDFSLICETRVCTTDHRCTPRCSAIIAVDVRHRTPSESRVKSQDTFCDPRSTIRLIKRVVNFFSSIRLGP